MVPAVRRTLASPFVALLALAAVLAGCGSDDPPADPPVPPASGDVDARLERVAGDFAAPLLVTAAPDGERILVVERPGRVWALRDGVRAPEPWLDVSDRISEGGERGLLGLAFHPDFAENGRIFVDYTDPAGDTRVVELSGEVGAERIDPAGREILRVQQPVENHNGGHLAFGPDGMLHVGLGDGGGAGDPARNGQDPTSLLGTILRIDVDAGGGEPYAIPPDNPFADGEDGAPEVAHFGLRNPWRFAFDPETGDLWIGDVGQATREEVDRVPAGTLGANLGWSTWEGTARHDDDQPGLDVAPHLEPVAEYGHDVGCSVTGGVVYRGSEVPALEGTYLYADYCSGRVYGIDAEDPGAGPRELTAALGPRIRDVRSFGVDAGGEVYLAAADAVWRIAPDPPEAG